MLPFRFVGDQEPELTPEPGDQTVALELLNDLIAGVSTAQSGILEPGPNDVANPNG